MMKKVKILVINGMDQSEENNYNNILTEILFCSVLITYFGKLTKKYD